LLLGLTGRLAVLFGGAWGERVVLHPRLWVVLVLGAASSGITAMTMPVLRSVLPVLLVESRRPAAFALHAAYESLGMMAGRALAGALIVRPARGYLRRGCRAAMF
jgi:urea transporter